MSEICELSDNFKKMFTIIDSNKYVKECISNKSKDIHSLSYIIDRQLSQSDCIKLGIGLEKIILDIILSNNPLLTNIKEKNIKNIKEKDHLFVDNNKKIIYYAELKSNLNLDTEKSKTTTYKCNIILEELILKYPDYKIEMYLVGNRYFDKKIIPKIILNKYLDIKDNIVGMNDYINHLCDKSLFENEEEYKLFLNYLANKMFS